VGKQIILVFLWHVGNQEFFLAYEWVVMVNFWHMKNQQNFKWVYAFKSGFGNFLACVESLHVESPFPKCFFGSFSQIVFSSFSSSYESFGSSSSYNE